MRKPDSIIYPFTKLLLELLIEEYLDPALERRGEKSLIWIHNVEFLHVKHAM